MDYSLQTGLLWSSTPGYRRLDHHHFRRNRVQHPPYFYQYQSRPERDLRCMGKIGVVDYDTDSSTNTPKVGLSRKYVGFAHQGRPDAETIRFLKTESICRMPMKSQGLSKPLQLLYGVEKREKSYRCCHTLAPWFIYPRRWLLVFWYS